MTRGVIFDLWRTLIPLTAGHKEAAMAGTAAALNSETREFRDVWAQTRAERETTLLLDYLRALRSRLSEDWTPAQMAAAMEARFEAHYGAFAGLRPDARDTLDRLRRSGLRVGLISNCSSDVRRMLADADLLPMFDAVVLSAEAGVMKPDPRIFDRAMRALEVTDGWYVGDGDDGELTGARAAGLVDVLLDLGDERHGTHRITHLSQILDIATEVRS